MTTRMLGMRTRKRKMMVHMPMRSMARRRLRRKRNNLPIPSLVVCLNHSRHCSTTYLLPLLATVAPSRLSPSDSDSDYGTHSKKKKRSRLSADEVRVSSRGGKIPNYVDDVADFEKFDSEEEGPNYYVDPNIQYKEEDEIEAVLSHQRDEERLSDPEDLWLDNIVCLLSISV